MAICDARKKTLHRFAANNGYTAGNSCPGCASCRVRLQKRRWAGADGRHAGLPRIFWNFWLR